MWRNWIGRAVAGAVGVAAAAFVATLTAACAGNAGVQSAPMARWGDVGPDTVSGIVRQVGNLPFVRTLIDDGDEGIFVTGELESEITRLAGAEVRATGTFTEGGQPGRYIDASSYEIVSIDGAEPAVGILGKSDGAYYLDLFSGELYPLKTIPSELQTSVGAKVWVITGEVGQVQAYGILREAGR